MTMVELDVEGDDPDAVIDAGRALGERVPDESEESLLKNNPILRAMGEIAHEFGVSVTLSVYPAGDEDTEYESLDDDGDDVTGADVTT